LFGRDGVPKGKHTYGAGHCRGFLGRTPPPTHTHTSPDKNTSSWGRGRERRGIIKRNRRAGRPSVARVQIRTRDRRIWAIFLEWDEWGGDFSASSPGGPAAGSEGPGPERPYINPKPFARHQSNCRYIDFAALYSLFTVSIPSGNERD